MGGVLALGVGCARYQPAPVDPESEIGRYGARSLDAPALAAYLDSLNPAPPAERWRSADLALASLFFRLTSLRLAREVAAARAGELAAGARPQPGLETEFEIDFSGQDGATPWAGALRAVFPLELGGKRAARIGKARAITLATLAAAQAEEWGMIQDVRKAVLEVNLADDERVRAETELGWLDSVAALVAARYQEGTVSASEVARARSDRELAFARLAGVRRAAAQARAALAALVGIPASDLAGRLIGSHEAYPACGAVAPEALDSLRRVAIGTRSEVRQVLAEYQVAEAELRAAVAESWPDLAIGPGLFYDHGVGKWLIGFRLPSLPLNGNRGGIAWAEARRSLTAARVAEVQEQVLTELDQSLAGCATAHHLAEAADSELSAVEEQLTLARQAYQRGETGRLELGQLVVERTRAAGVRNDARGAEDRAGLAVDRALGVWSGTPPVRWPGWAVAARGARER